MQKRVIFQTLLVFKIYIDADLMEVYCDRSRMWVMVGICCADAVADYGAGDRYGDMVILRGRTRNV